MISTTHVRGLLCAALFASSAGCPTEYNLENKGEITDEECDNLCAQQEAESLPYDCFINGCGYNEGDYLDTGDFVADLGQMNGGTCELVVWCAGGSCLDEYQDCVEDSNSVADCDDPYYDCVRDAACATERAECEAEADTEFDDCIAISGPDCGFWHQHALDTCACEEVECLTGHENSACGALPQLAPPAAPPPVQTGPQRWTVHRSLIDHELANLDRLMVETAAWPIAGPTGGLAGVRLESVDADEVAYALGMRNKDAVVTINGVAVAQALVHPEQLLSLENSNVIRIGVRRGGVLRNHRYDLVP